MFIFIVFPNVRANAPDAPHRRQHAAEGFPEMESLFRNAEAQPLLHAKRKNPTNLSAVVQRFTSFT